MKWIGLVLGLVGMYSAQVLCADTDTEFDDVKLSIHGRVALGAAMRMENRDPNNVGKLNIPGQQQLCASDSCYSLSGDTEPNARLIAAAGAFGGSNGDNGNLNYGQYDLVSADSLLDLDVNASWEDFGLRLHGLGFWDPVNNVFKESHIDTTYQPASTQRPGNITRDLGRRAEWLDAYLQYAGQIDDHTVSATVGYQRLHWGEATFLAHNTLNTINPPSAVMLHLPGAQLDYIFRAVPLIHLSFNLTEKVSAELIYQLDWVPAQPNPAGSFFSDSDVAGGGRYAMTGFGAFSEDPDRKFVPPGLVGLISKSTRTAYLLQDDYGEPSNSGQFGISLSYLADDLNNGTELGFYALNYHSRLPYLSAYAAQQSCITPGITDFAAALIACEGFNGSINPSGFGKEPFPIDTVRPFLEYPENLQMYGLSFNTNIGRWSVSGEFTYHPNLPVQIRTSDVLFAALQPAFPANNIGFPVNTAPLNVFTIPSNRRAVPDFISTYRGITIAENDYIPGYERLEVGQMDLTGLLTLRGEYIGADQILLIAEAAATKVFNMPDISRLQFEGGGLNGTHASPGADGTGSGGVPDTARLNPTQQVDGFATPFSWGVRFASSATYSHLIFDWSLRPGVALFYDVKGISPSPMQNFVEGVTHFYINTEIRMSNDIKAQITYQGIAGGGRLDTTSDRDSLALALSYSF